MAHIRSLSLAAMLAVTAVTGLALIERAGDGLPVASGGANGPELQVARGTHDFGTVSAGTVLRATFAVRNAGTERLILHEQSHSCGCLSGGVPEIVVPAGASRKIELTFQTDRLDGAVRKRLEYRTNDRRNPTLHLTVFAEVRRHHP